MNKRFISDEKGASFVESLVTIVVAGMACVAFISVTAAIVRETKNQEVEEAMVQYALNGLEKVRAINAKNEGYIIYEEGGDNGGMDGHGGMKDIPHSNPYCFKLDENDLVLLSSLGEVDCTGQSSECEKLDLDEGDEFFYRKVEIIQAHATNDKVLKVKIEVGRIDPTADDNLNTDYVEGFIAVK